MATIEQAVRSMLITGTTLSNGTPSVPDDRVTHGYRLQDSILPAVTYTVDTREDASVGGETQISQVTVTSIAETSEDALAVAAKVRTALVRGTYNSIEFDAVMVTADGLQPEVVGLSDEQEPSQAVTQATIYWRP
jgi:hypothetical protein